MLKSIVALLFFTSGQVAYAIDDESFGKCVQIKDMTMVIAEQADKGATRSELKAKVSSASASVHELIDFVYDFRGAKSNQEIGAKAMDSCLKTMASKAKRK